MCVCVCVCACVCACACVCVTDWGSVLQGRFEVFLKELESERQLKIDEVYTCT